MMRRTLAAIALLALVLGTIPAFPQAKAQMEKALHSAYQELLKELDKNKDGKLSVAECCSAFKDPAVGKKKCTYWDQNGDGIITEKEYVDQGMKIE